MKTVTAMALVLAVFSMAATSADAHSRKKGAYSQHYSKAVKPQVRGYIARGGGYAAGYDPQFSRSGPYDGAHSSYDNRSFWERVQSDPFDNRPGVSAY